MAKKTKETEVVTETVTETVSEPSFTKKQLVQSLTFGKYRDYLSANLEDGKSYTKAEVTKMIEKTYKVTLNIN